MELERPEAGADLEHAHRRPSGLREDPGSRARQHAAGADAEQVVLIGGIGVVLEHQRQSPVSKPTGTPAIASSRTRAPPVLLA